MKKFLSILLAVLMLTAMLTVTTGAADVNYSSGTGTLVCVDNYYIVERLVNLTNGIIEDMVQRELAKPNPNIDLLVARTNAIANAVMQVASALGVEVVCEYTEYEYNGQVFYIDPLIVIRR